MNTFIVLVVVLTAVALLCVLPALLRREHGGAFDDAAAVQAESLNLAVLRDQARELDADLRAGALAPELRQQARDDLAMQLAGTASTAPARPRGAPQTWTALVLALAIPALAALVYQQVGNPGALSLVEQAQQARDGSHQAGPREIAGMVQGLAERLQREPGDREGWFMLARSYAVLGRYHDAAAAYARLARLAPDDPDVLADYADALATANGASLQGEPQALIERALKLDPKHVKALALAGGAAFDGKQYARAIAYWEAALAQAPDDSEFAAATAASIAEARVRLGGTTPTAVQSGQDGAALIAGTVTLSPALTGAAGPEDTVFIYARAPQGAPMPLAIRRAKVKDLPLQFTLKDADSMAGARLSDHRHVRLVARISRSGSATPAAGDPEAVSDVLGLPARGLTLHIDQLRK